MEHPDYQAVASVGNTPEIPEEHETSVNSLVPVRVAVPGPLPPVSPTIELPSTSNLPALPELLSPQLRSLFSSPADARSQDAIEFPSVPRNWGKPEAEKPEVSSQLPNQPMPNTPEEGTFYDLKQRISARLECLLCIEIMLPPIVLCSNGHMICDKCRPKLEKCPLCRY
jgi:hypothetical protein